jgi:hypothetical protein
MLELNEVHTIIRVSHHLAPDIVEVFMSPGTVVLKQRFVVFISQSGLVSFFCELHVDIEKYVFYILTGNALSRTWDKVWNAKFVISPVLFFALIDVNVNTILIVEISFRNRIGEILEICVSPPC